MNREEYAVLVLVAELRAPPRQEPVEAWQARRDTFLSRCSVGCADLYGRTTVTLPSGETEVLHQKHLEQGLDARFRSIDPPPADEGEPGEVRRCWTATLTTAGGGEREVGFVAAGRIDPPAAFVAATLNAVAAEGWSVHHVAEDRSMEGQDVRLVSVRYLLRRDP